MKLDKKTLLLMGGAFLIIIAATSTVLHAASADGAAGPVAVQNAQADAQDTPGSRLNRIDFGNTYIIGQSIKSGAVYLLQRKKSEIKSMLKYREDYRQEILEGFTADAGQVPARDTAPGRSSGGGRHGSGRLVSQE
jgi:hypothetical protein